MREQSVSIPRAVLLSMMERLHASRRLAELAAEVVKIKAGDSGRLACTILDLEQVSNTIREISAYLGVCMNIEQTQQMFMADYVVSVAKDCERQSGRNALERQAAARSERQPRRRRAG